MLESGINEKDKLFHKRNNWACHISILAFRVHTHAHTALAKTV